MKNIPNCLFYNQKLLMTGNVWELLIYENGVYKGVQTKQRERIGRKNAANTSEETKKENRRKTAYRAKRYVRLMANANPDLDRFFTCTFADNPEMMTDLAKAHREFQKFIKRVQTYINRERKKKGLPPKKIKYIAVTEFQKRGAIHFHLLCNFDYIYFKELGKLWRNGTIYIKRIDDVDNVGAYITKYMTKDNIDERLKGKKCYTMSKGLKTPTVYTNEKKIKKIMESIPEKDIIRTITKEYESEYYGKITYVQIVLRTAPKFLPRKRGLLDFINRRLVRLSDDLPTPFDE